MLLSYKNAQGINTIFFNSDSEKSMINVLDDHKSNIYDNKHKYSNPFYINPNRNEKLSTPTVTYMLGGEILRWKQYWGRLSAKYR